MGAHEKITDPIWFPWQRVIRTALQVIAAAGVFLGAVAAVAPQIIRELVDVLPGPFVVWATGAIAFLAAVAAGIARVMALPIVNAWMTALGAGSVPASGYASGTEPDDERTTAGYPDELKTEPEDALG